MGRRRVGAAARRGLRLAYTIKRFGVEPAMICHGNLYSDTAQDRGQKRHGRDALDLAIEGVPADELVHVIADAHI